MQVAEVVVVVVRAPAPVYRLAPFFRRPEVQKLRCICLSLQVMTKVNEEVKKVKQMLDVCLDRYLRGLCCCTGGFVVCCRRCCRVLQVVAIVTDDVEEVKQCSVVVVLCRCMQV